MTDPSETARGHAPPVLSAHARDRWEERGDGRPVQEAIALASLPEVSNRYERES
jgi:hypothetical protein